MRAVKSLLPVGLRNAKPKMVLTLGVTATSAAGLLGPRIGIPSLADFAAVGSLLVNVIWIWEDAA